MRTFLPILLLLLALPLQAQNNPYEIDDQCYPLFQECEKKVGTEGFDAVSRALLQKARETGDRKAETLYYVVALKNRTHTAPSPENDKAVEEAFLQLKDVAKETGYIQYYYYAYQLSQTYYYNAGQPYRTLSLTREMQETALREGDQYGLWTSDKYLAQLYISQNDYVSAKTNILEAIRVYNNSTDETIRRQSLTRLYCDLADTYPIGSDSVRINVAKAAECAKQHLDSLRVMFYHARLAALDKDLPLYKACRDAFLADPMHAQISSDFDVFFGIIDDVIAHRTADLEERVARLKSIRRIKVVANLCERYEDHDMAFRLEKIIVARLENALSRTNLSRLSELDITMGKAALSANLEKKDIQISRYSILAAILLIAMLSVIIYLLWTHARHLEKTNEQVRLANEAKTRFVQNMSHEVRTPLNAIVGFSQLLSLPDGALSPEEKDEFSGHIINNSQMLTMLLDDILNASAMDKGEYSINYEDGECHFMCRAAISSTEHRLQPGVRMYYAPESEAPFTFRTDPRRTQQILINLLSNACKHTVSGEIKLSSSLTEHPGFVTFAVTDTGSGVPADQAEAIFARFTKLNEFVQGTGLGLSICRDIAERMGGKVWLDTSWTQGGSRFVFTLPVQGGENAG